MKNLFLNAAISLTLIFGLTNCEKVKDQLPDTHAQWTNCEGRWNGTALNCSGSGCCCLAEVVVTASKLTDDLINDGEGIEGIGVLVETFKSEEAKKLFTSLNAEQIALLASGNYVIKPLILEPELYASKKQGRVKFFAAKKSVFLDQEATLEDYDFNFGVDIRE